MNKIMDSNDSNEEGLFDIRKISLSKAIAEKEAEELIKQMDEEKKTFDNVKPDTELLSELLDQLFQSKTIHDEFKSKLDKLVSEFESQPEVIEYVKKVQVSSYLNDSIDSIIRKLAVQYFIDNGKKDKQIIPGISISDNTEVDFEYDKALSFAIKLATSDDEDFTLLKLDEKAFKKYAKALLEVNPKNKKLSFVKIKKIPTANISKERK